MAFSGLKKQLNKANQYMTEKIGGAEGTKLDVDFMEMERRTDVTNELVEELQMKTKEFLQPNPTARAKMAAVKGISKLSGQAKNSTYPQPEGILGDCLLLYGKKLGDSSVFGQAMLEFGEGMKQMADVKYYLDDCTKQNFLEPLHQLQTKDLKEVMHHRKKLQGRRLDFDCKKRRLAKGAHLSDEELRVAEEKFVESLHSTQLSMFTLLENEVEQISQLTAFAEAVLEYHQQCTEIMKVTVRALQQKRDEAASKPKKQFIPKTPSDSGFSDPFQLNGSALTSSSSPLSDAKSADMNEQRAESPASTSDSLIDSMMMPPAPVKEPCCVALYDFDPENPTELGFKEGDIIRLITRIDENWFEGFLNGRTGYFPVSYVQVVNPLK